MANIILLIVLYNKDINESETLQSLFKWDNEHRGMISELIIWDNSPKSLCPSDQKKIKEIFRNSKFSFYGDGNNYALSTIYNTIIRSIQCSSGWFVILDHDSNINQTYIDEIIAINNFESCPRLILPQVYYNYTLVSPARLYFFIGKYIKKITPGLMKSRFRTAINSGMCISIEYLKSSYPGYNEDIKFYGTDNDFMWKYQQDNVYFYVMKEKINHILNYYEDTDLLTIKNRMADNKRGMFALTKMINPILVPFAYIYWLMYSVKNFIFNR